MFLMALWSEELTGIAMLLSSLTFDEVNYN